jgi:hypothetical protein
MSALRWAWRCRSYWPLFALVAAALACIQWEPTPIGVVIVVVSPVIGAMAAAAVDITVPAWRGWRYERAVIRSIRQHPATRKGTAA